MTFGDRLKELRNNKDWTQDELSIKIDMNINSIKKMETNRVSLSVDTLIKLSSLFDVTTDYLLKGESIGSKSDTFGSRIKQLRTDHKWTQDRMADKLGVTAQVISNYERDYREPEFSTLVDIAKLFKVTTDYLLGYEVEK